jgi:hypothetical protein
VNLAQKQRLFARLISELILEITERGYEVTLGESWRPPEMAKIYAAQGRGITNSLHWSRLAVDLNLFLGGKQLTKSEEYKEVGELWESKSGKDYKCAWGGRFSDGNHFSIEHNGVR